MKIALTFSGGGFRAAAFSLGTLSLLESIKFGDKRLLDQVCVLSTVSGGTITGARFALGNKRNESFTEIYESLYEFMSNSKLIVYALEHLGDDKKWTAGRVRNLITSFSDIYDKELFKGARFGELMVEGNEMQLRHVSFNSTDFANANQFRFQWSERINKPAENEPERGIIGNTFLRVPYDFARDIRLADIMASSSCFPGGFEPINFPDDFVFSTGAGQALKDPEKYPVGLMDGGIVDNQGIDPVILAESRMKRNRTIDDQQNVIDLVMICEVASPYMDGFKASEQNEKGWWKKFTPEGIAITNVVFWLISLLGVIFSFVKGQLFIMMISTAIFTVTNIIWGLFSVINRTVRGSGVPEEFLEPLGKLAKLKLFVYQNLLMNRFNSVLMLTMNVFLKHVRRLNYKVLYSDDSWKNRRIMNAVYELRSSEKGILAKVARGKLPKELLPSKLIQANSDTAASMSTTLWFTKNELEEQDMLNTLIACGQYNTCWNLLEYIYLLKDNNDNTNPEHVQLMACEGQLMSLWEQFQTEPKFMVNVLR